MVTLSVVMSVFNAAPSLDETLASILTQSFRDFELIVIDDGSTDATPEILARAAAGDSRLRVLTQANTGLTRALIRGCEEARGTFIARHDAGDRSVPERFAKQLALLNEGHVLVACATRWTDGAGHLLYETYGDGEEIRRSLLHDPVTTIQGLPHHGTAMFRRDRYVQAGGYRAQFRVAQDLDLWIRMARLGTVAVTREVLYESTIEPHGISSVARDRQVLAATIAIAIRDGGDEAKLLDQAARLARPRTISARRRADGHYFLARCLLAQRNPAWRGHAWRAVLTWPLHARAWWTLLVPRSGKP